MKLDCYVHSRLYSSTSTFSHFVFHRPSCQYFEQRLGDTMASLTGLEGALMNDYHIYKSYVVRSLCAGLLMIFGFFKTSDDNFMVANGVLNSCVILLTKSF